FGDGASSTGCSATHVYSNLGTFTVVVTAQDGLGVTASKTVSEVVNARPTVSFTITPTSAISSQSLTFTATIVGGPNPFTFNWNFGDGTTASGNPVNHSFNMPGTYTVTVTVTDANTMTVTVPAGILVNPLLLAVTISGPTTGTLGRVVTFTATGSGGTTPYTF